MSHSATQSAFLTALVDPKSPIPPGFVSPRGDVDPLRFAVYRNNVHVGLVNALAARFPVCRRLVGAEFFTATARVYVGENKPTSPLMIEYGDTFPEFLSAFPPAQTVSYLPDIARLEVLWSRAYNAADAAALEPAALSALAPEDLLNCRLSLHPAAGLVHSRFPVGSIWSANQSEKVKALSAHGPESVIVARPGSQVRINIVPLADVPFATSLFRGDTIGRAAAAAEDPGFDFGSALVGLVSLGAFAEIVTPGGRQ